MHRGSLSFALSRPLWRESLCPIVISTLGAKSVWVSTCPYWTCSKPFGYTQIGSAVGSSSSYLALSSCLEYVGLLRVPSSRVSCEVAALISRFQLYRGLQWACHPHKGLGKSRTLWIFPLRACMGRSRIIYYPRCPMWESNFSYHIHNAYFKLYRLLFSWHMRWPSSPVTVKSASWDM